MASGLVDEGLLVGQVGGVVGFEGLGAEEVHAVGGAGAGDDDEAGDVAGSGDLGALGGDEVVGFGGGFERDVVEEDVGVLLEEAGELAQAVLPGGAVDDEMRARAGGARLLAFSLEKSAEASSSLARTCCSVLTFR